MNKNEIIIVIILEVVVFYTGWKLLDMLVEKYPNIDNLVFYITVLVISTLVLSKKKLLQ